MLEERSVRQSTESSFGNRLGETQKLLPLLLLLLLLLL